jgi:hypothetical protein
VGNSLRSLFEEDQESLKSVEEPINLDASDETSERDHEDGVASRKEVFWELGGLEENCGHANESTCSGKEVCKDVEDEDLCLAIPKSPPSKPKRAETDEKE